MAPQHKRIVYSGQKGLDSHIARLTATGWKLKMTQIYYYERNRKVYIAELEKE